MLPAPVIASQMWWHGCRNDALGSSDNRTALVDVKPRTSVQKATLTCATCHLRVPDLGDGLCRRGLCAASGEDA
eukprot:6184047-Pleurochrysis_carterae.AAC.2